MARWDYSRIKSTSIAICSLLIFAFSLVLYKMAAVKSLMETFLCCVMFIALILMSGYTILWWMNRPEH